jgi:hypothetical protein
MRLAPFAIILLSLPAWAQDRPQLTPARDVTVTYRTSGEGEAQEMQMSWLTARGLLRVDMPGGQGWLVTDTRGSSGFMVMEAQRTVMELPAGRNPGAMATLRDSARYTREGADRVAGLPCIVWRIEEGGATNRACVTADGVMLRAATGGARQAVMEAVSVRQAPQDPARFERPRGFQSFQMPGGVPQGAGATLPRGTALPPPGLPQQR